MGFFDAIGKIVNPKNILTVGGFALGGPPGAALGRGVGGAAFGDNWDPTDDGSFSERLGGGIKGGIEGAAMGMGGQALGLPGSSKGFSDLPVVGGIGGGGGGAGGLPGGIDFNPIASGVESAVNPVADLSSVGMGGGGLGGGAAAAANAAGAGVAGGEGGFLGSIKNMWGDLNSYEKLMMGAQGLGAVGDLYGSISEGQLAQEQADRRAAFSEALAPYFRDTLEGLASDDYYTGRQVPRERRRRRS